jgi:hypothetical protein
MDVGSKLGGAAGDEVAIVAPLGLLQDVLQKQELKFVQQQLFSQGAEQPLHEEGEEGVVGAVAKGVVTHHRHSLDYHPDSFVELKFLVLEALLRVPLHWVDHCRLRHMKILKKLDIWRAYPAREVEGVSRGGSLEESLWGDLWEEVGVVGHEDEIFSLVGVGPSRS